MGVTAHILKVVTLQYKCNLILVLTGDEKSKYLVGTLAERED